MRNAEPIGPDDIASAERGLGFTLPPALVALCLHSNGGAPDRSWLIDEERGTEQQVDWFLPVKPAGSPDKRGLVGTYLRMTEEGLLPASSLPFAINAGGNFFLLDRNTGRIWFMPMDEWEHEETAEQNWARSGRTLADSFKAFLDALTDEAPDWARD
jgi:hypothetical protein